MGIGFTVIGRKIGQEIKKFVNIVFEARKGDNRNALLYNSAGEDSVPLDDERLILVKTDGTGKYVAVGVLTQSQGAKPGEKIFFGRDAQGEITSKLSMLNDGTVKTETEKDVIQAIKGKKHETIEGDNDVEIKGKFYFGNGSQNMAKLFIGLIDEIIALETFGPPTKHKVMPSSIQRLEAYKQVITALIKENV